MSFETGFNLPNAPVQGSSAPKKRKRPSEVEMELPEVDVEKLLAKYDKLLKGDSKTPAKEASNNSSKKQKKAQRSKESRAEETSKSENFSAEPVAQDTPNASKKSKKNKQDKADPGALTNMQQKAKDKLGGARFRWINEQLYTSNGFEAAQMMKKDPSVFREYHSGFQSQAASWPTNPLDLLISSIAALPAASLVIDLGAGEGRLAQELIKKSFKVISYDLVSPNPYVQVAQCTTHVPLPGDIEGKGSIADVVVCCLSLMGKDWFGMVLEAQRILRRGGKLKIAEVASRFTDVAKFEKAVEAAGFKLLSKDDSNTHFVLFDFERKGMPVKKEQKDQDKLLKPCIYKKR